MHARIVTVHVKPQDVEEISTIYNESILPAAREQSGFRGATFVVDAKSGKGISVTLWATERDLRAGEQNGYYQEQVAKCASLFTSAPQREEYHVAAHVAAEPLWA